MQKKLNKIAKDTNYFLRRFITKQKKSELIVAMKYGLFSGGKKIRSKRPAKKKTISKVKVKLKKNFKLKKRNKNPQKTRAIVAGLIRLNDKVKSIFRFNINLDQTLQRFFVGISNKRFHFNQVV